MMSHWYGNSWNLQSVVLYQLQQSYVFFNTKVIIFVIIDKC